MFSVIVLCLCVVLFIVERRLNARAGKRSRSNHLKRVASPRKR